MRGMIRTLALGAVLAAGAATGVMAQGINNTGYDRSYYGDPGYYGNRDVSGNRSSFGYGDRGYGGYYGYDRCYPTGPVMPPHGYRYNYSGDTYGYGSSYGPGWGSGGGAAYDRGYNRPYNYGYWGR